VPWERLHRIQHAVCWRWYRRFDERIPLQEWLSEANEALAWAILHYDPTQSAQFTTFLSAVLQRHMRDVPRREWGSLVTRQWDSARRRYVVGSERYPVPETFVPVVRHTGRLAEGERWTPVPTPLTQTGNQEAFTMLLECLRHVATHVNAREQAFLLHSVEGDDGPTIAQRAGVTEDVVFQRVRKTRQQLQAWSEEVSLAAAD
jgi:DNA-directed RNA polymerase specialized sigma24 family protein